MEGMLSYKGAMQPIQVSGVDPAEEGKVSIVAQHIVQGVSRTLKPGEFGVVIGEITARRFRLNVGDKLTLIVPEVSKEPGGITPRMQRLNVVGIFKVGRAGWLAWPDPHGRCRECSAGRRIRCRACAWR
jgi:lipoprotein-releasing system permease protein